MKRDSVSWRSRPQVRNQSESREKRFCSFHLPLHSSLLWRRVLHYTSFHLQVNTLNYRSKCKPWQRCHSQRFHIRTEPCSWAVFLENVTVNMKHQRYWTVLEQVIRTKTVSFLFTEVQAAVFNEDGVTNYSTMLIREDLALLLVGAKEAVYSLDLNNITRKQSSVSNCWQNDLLLKMHGKMVKF